MQTLTLNSSLTRSRLPDPQTPERLRAFRYVSQRYAQRERPGVAAEFLLFALIAFTATWPIFTLVHALGLRH
ncbi:MAG: hypothetical protein M3429_00820 [Verrucomicrobiota bacterium]|jgi:hypothetical protein|nr:hypothetical protein [Verrucomicrobiota bacterium]